MYIFSLWPVALLIHLDPFGVRFPFFGNAGFKISPSLDYNGAKWTSCCVAQKDPLPPKNGEKLCNSFFLQKSWPGYSKISRSLAVSTDYFLSVELHCSNICLCKRTRASTCEVWLIITAGGEHLSGSRFLERDIAAQLYTCSGYSQNSVERQEGLRAKRKYASLIFGLSL